MPQRALLGVVSDTQNDFALMLVGLGCKLAAVREMDGPRYFLAINCNDEAHAEEHTAAILASLLISDTDWRRELRLGSWMARRVAGRLLIFWDGVEVEHRALH